LKHFSGGGFDIVVDSALGPDFNKIPDLCNPGGRIVFFGGTAGNIPELNGRPIFWKQLQILGTTMGTQEEFKAMLSFVAEHQIVPVIDEVFPMKDAAKAFAKMGNSAQFGKLVITVYSSVIEFRVDGMKWELQDTATFYLVEKILRPVPYRAGQFLTFVFDHHGEEIRRSYSLSSSPDDDRLAITVKRISNGEISRFLLSKVKVGDMLTAIEPAGVFTPGNYEAAKDLVYFAAGSGITPLLSHIKYILNRKGQSKLHLLYSNRDKQSILFHNELTELEHKYPDRLNITYLLSSDANRLNNYKVEQLVKQQLQYSGTLAEFYLCGPFPYMRMISLTLQYHGRACRADT
jgi:ferredoxin-NADP reductase